ncbi:hypothetical protein [Prauserella halophila]|uniref:hypothetical protein n=1 Tax=Prauserella halophila TaxID=185641 RepID=UPI0035562F4F
MPKPSFGRLSGRGKSGSRRRDDADNATPRAAAPAGRDDTDDHGGEDQELSSYLKALAPDNDVESTGSGRKFGEAQVYQLRMTHAAGEELSELAEARGTSPQALALEWVLERLAWEAESVPSADPAGAEAAQPEAGYRESEHRESEYRGSMFQDEHQDAGVRAAPYAEPPAAAPGEDVPRPGEDVPRPGEDTDPHGRAVPPLAAAPGGPRHASGPGRIEPEARTDEHFFDRSGWDAPGR